MGLLHKLWDETLAGPAPESGLGKLRKYNSFSARSTAAASPDLVVPPQIDKVSPTPSIPVPRSNNYRNLSVSVDSPPLPSSPSCSSAPNSPFSRKSFDLCYRDSLLLQIVRVFNLSFRVFEN